MSRALRDINVGIAIMCGVASGYYIFDPVVREVGEEYKRTKAEAREISQVVCEPVESIQAQLSCKPPPRPFQMQASKQSHESAPRFAA